MMLAPLKRVIRYSFETRGLLAQREMCAVTTRSNSVSR
jgi:hypothetical protein